MEEDFTTFGGDYQTVRLLNGKDGLPIRLHEDVWGEDGKKWRIVGIGERYVWGEREGTKGQRRLKPEWLAHEEPDSFERILDDAVNTSPVQYCYDHDLGAFSLGDNRPAKMADLVRRCEALAVRHGDSVEGETCEALPVEAGDQFRRCSNCGFDGWCDQESVTPYCPECGAKVAKVE
jgi:hypothetical protein